jgi:hypothetical protein
MLAIRCVIQRTSRTSLSLRHAAQTDHLPARRCLRTRVSPAELDRALRIADAFIKASEARGMRIELDEEPGDHRHPWCRITPRWEVAPRDEPAYELFSVSGGSGCWGGDHCSERGGPGAADGPNVGVGIHLT